jgi:hypothetical protein
VTCFLCAVAGYMQLGNPHSATLSCMKVVDADVRRVHHSCIINRNAAFRNNFVTNAQGRGAWRLCLCDCTTCHPATMSPLDLPVPLPDGCGDRGDGGEEQASQVAGGEEEGGAGLGRVRLPSATHRVMEPGTLTPAYMSNRLGR